MVTHARPLDSDDADSVAVIDRVYAGAHGLERRASAASLRFFARSGHAFVAEADAGVLGFVLAQPLFDGERPTLFASRLASPPPGDEDALRALLKALTKSAYDAGIYDIRVELPEGDAAGAAALAAEDYGPSPATVYARQLGSRAAAVASAARGEEGDRG
ncbi:MAG TPA: DUF1999 family protein [Trueperaceae bacterium]|nr:DUF1999 family protein [Trueperaceae bacterium]